MCVLCGGIGVVYVFCVGVKGWCVCVFCGGVKGFCVGAKGWCVYVCPQPKSRSLEVV